MSLRTKYLAALLTTAFAIPATSFAYWIPSNSEQGGTEVIAQSNPKSRTQVLQELAQAKADPSWSTRQGEETGTRLALSTEQAKSRAEVQQELKSMSVQEIAYLQSFYTGA